LHRHRLLPIGALAVALCGVAHARAEDAPAPPGLRDDPWALEPPVSGAQGLLLFHDGSSVEARIVLAWDRALSVRVAPGAQVLGTAAAGTIRLIPLEAVRGFVSLRRSSAHADARRFRVLLDDGTVRDGTLLDEDAEVVLLGGPGGPRPLPRAHIRRMWRVGRAAWDAVDALASAVKGSEGGSMSSAGRHLEVASDLETAPGAVRLRVLRGAHLIAGWAPRSDVALELGTALPVLHVNGAAGNVQAAVRGSLELLPGLRAGAGAHLDTSRDGRTAGALSASLTAGGPGAALTLYAGPTFAGGEALARLGELSAAAAGSLRLTHRLDLVAEAWTSDRGDGREVLGVGALRTRLRWLTLDLGGTWARRGGAGLWAGLAVEVRP